MPSFPIRPSATSPGWSMYHGRSIKDHRKDIRKYFGFRECSLADSDKAADWPAAEVCPKEQQVDRVRAELLAHLRQERIEGPVRNQIRRIIGTVRADVGGRVTPSRTAPGSSP